MRMRVAAEDCAVFVAWVTLLWKLPRVARSRPGKAAALLDAPNGVEISPFLHFSAGQTSSTKMRLKRRLHCMETDGAPQRVRNTS